MNDMCGMYDNMMLSMNVCNEYDISGVNRMNEITFNKLIDE